MEASAKGLAADQGRSLVGRPLGSYKILSMLGAGGTGEVYQANDDKLGRTVATKVLPAAFVHDPERHEAAVYANRRAAAQVQRALSRLD